jgi:hypothetical protein
MTDEVCSRRRWRPAGFISWDVIVAIFKLESTTKGFSLSHGEALVYLLRRASARKAKACASVLAGGHGDQPGQTERPAVMSQ